ncbi:PAS domain S-box protein [Desertivirga brevis]|uniref:PAS domain S-box protein n=1 Tax=Desertivirga brevis TaxID=2810310 RepID=UPI001A96C936|nr:PAS domain S-box protein [Pedobacter sp. SYSU D00873]
MEKTVNEGLIKRNSTKLDHYVVAIGASAGGLEAIHEFFDNMPTNANFSFIVIQHLSPDYKSLLVELVSKHTHMKVFEAEDKMTVQKECIYVIPNNKLMTIYNGKLHLVEKVPDKQPNTAIDRFLYSLAQEKKDKAIAIILSGTGSDGTRGIEVIKSCGGMVIVQDPVTAKFDGMPNSAIASGNADLILPPEMIPEEIYNHVNESPILVLNKGKIDDRLLDDIFNLIHKAHGYDFHYYKTPTIIRRIGKRMGQHNIKKLDDYVAVLRQSPEEVKSLSKDFLIGVTRFFRDKQAFEALFQQVLPDIVNDKQDGEILKVWICACSTGEEAYSLAILIDQYIQRFRRLLEVKIFATDIDESSIGFAAKNLYPQSIEKDIDEDTLKKYFVKEGKSYSIIPRIRKQIVFARHNVIKDPPFIKNDLVSCRNMLIYMNSVLQQKVMNTLHFSINTGGYLFLGTSETASSIKDSVDEVNSKWKIYRKIGKNRISPYEVYRQLDNKGEQPRISQTLTKSIQKKSNPLAEDLTEAIIDDFGYVCFYIDKNYEIKESVGNFSRFLSLPEKKLNLNILKMVPQELSVALNTAIRKSWKEETKVFLKSVRVKQDQADLFLSISVRPAEPLRGKPYTLVVLGENSLSQIHVREESHPIPSAEHNEYIAELEAELNETRSNLQMAVEGLETTNEELQSSNEELLSANEELQSSNEELQSLNEELHTLNTEHQLKIKELIELNDDLNNYFRSTDIGQIFIDRNQNIRKFNASALRLVNLIESDIGRPISHISTNIRYENLLRDIAHVIDTDEIVEKEIILTNDRRYLMRIMPYVRQDKRTDGAIITFVDISAIANLNNIINGVFNSSLSSIIAFKAVRNYNSQIEDFVILTCNYASDTILGGSINQAGKHLNEIASLSGTDFSKSCVEVVDKGNPLHTELSIGDRWYEVVAVKMMDGFVATFTDITDKRDGEQKLRQNYNELISVRENLKQLNLELEDKVIERTRELSISEERFRLVSKATNDAIWDWDLVNNSLWWSDSFFKLFGYDDSEEVHSSNFWISKIHPEDRDRVRKSINSVINKGSDQWTEEYRFEKNDGSYACILDRGYLLQDEYGTPYRMLGSRLDISELKEAQYQIIKSESRFRKVFESNMIGMLFTNKDSVIINANDAFLQMIGYSKEDLKNGLIAWSRITPPEFLEKNRLAAEQIWTSGVCPPFEGEYLRKDGSRICVLLGAASVSEDDAVAVTYIIDITAKKEAEKKEQELQRIIQKQQDEFKGIFMNAPALISIRRGEDLRVEFVNQTAMDYFERSDLVGKNNRDLIGEYKPASTESHELIQQVYKTGIPFFGKAFHIRFDKNRTGILEDAWFDFVYQPVYSNEGIVDGVATFAFDVSDMIRANQEIKKNEGRFRFLAESVPQKVWTAKPDGLGEYFNKVWLDYTGKDMHELEGWQWLNVIHPEDREKNRELWLQSVKSGLDFEMERRILGADGEYRWHLSRSIPQRDDNGEIVIWVGTSTDIHDQKTASEALKESEDYFRQLADQSPFMIWKVDEKGDCNYVNKKWISFTGLSFNDSMGLGWSKAFHQDDADKEYNKFLKAFEAREIFYSKFRLRSIKGEYHWVLAQANPVFGGSFEGYIGSLTDITEQELAQQATKLLMQKKDEFMSIASHELKTPITSMKASLQIAERLSTRKVEVEKIQSFIEKANKQVNRLTALVEDLLDVTKIQAGKLQFEKDRFYIDEVVQSSVDQMQNDSIRHTILVEGEKEIPVWGDMHRLEQVIVNFLSNAIKYSPDSEKVLVNIRKEEDKVRVYVTDFGIGIPEDKINFVFDRFFRVQESSQKFSGLGLGLFISAEIVKRHEGDVGVYSEEGKGSTFWFDLPIAN